MTSPFTCITCRVTFRDLEIQRQHYKSDWHRYNLKRKVADLPPVTVEEFKKRVIAQQSNDDEPKRQHTLNCTVCKKHFSTRNQYDNHLSSKRHKEKVAVAVAEAAAAAGTAAEPCTDAEKPDDSAEIDSDDESLDSDESSTDKDTENPLKDNYCLFCAHRGKSLIRNLRHMSVAHSFFIPDPDYCTDVKGFLMYLGEKIFAGYMCIWCNENGKAFHSAEAARAHMIDKGHCKVLHEGDALLEYADFYDYSSSYPDAENADPDAEVEISAELDGSDYQLVLPSGNVIGHRSLMRYYKQSFNPNRVVPLSKNDKLRKVLSQYRALGWTDTKTEAALKKARDIKYMHRIRTKYSTQLQFKANNLQNHFRRQVNF